MTQMIADANLIAALQNCGEPVELRDNSGHVLGRFFPTVDLSAYEPWEPPISEEELRRREQANEKRYTTAEVLAHLEKL